MRRLLLLLSITGPVGSAAGATEPRDKPLLVPAPAWVKPLAIPAPDPAAADAPAQTLLFDEQVRLDPDRQARYVETAFRIQSAQALAGGNIVLPWNPDKQTLQIHKLHVLRGDKIIDVLATGPGFAVIRREKNLELAAIDGVLTATIQPEGLQVGDVIDLAMTVITQDPVTANHAEAVGAGWNGGPITRAHFRAEWPATMPVRLRGVGDLGPLKPTRSAAAMSLEISRDALKPIPESAGAPPRYRYGRIVELSDAPGWGSIAALMTPLYVRAATLSADSPLRAELTRIRALSPDPVIRAEAALAVTQEQVRYVFVGLNDGGLVPANADTTWTRRFGDCKGKTVLLLALLHGLGIDAQPVLVSSVLGDGLDARLPLLGLFDHVLVRATIAGRTYWLDGTRPGDKRLANIVTPDFHWGLPLTAASDRLVPIRPMPLTVPDTDVTLRLDATKGVFAPVPAHAERVLRGDAAIGLNLQLVNLTTPVRDEGLRQFWRGRYDFIDPKSVAVRFDAATATMTLVRDGVAKLDWDNGWYEADGVWVGYKADFTRDPKADQTVPFAVTFPSYVRTVETILLPPGQRFHTDKTVSDLDDTVAGVEYHRRATVADGRFTVEESERTIASEFPAADAPAAQERLRALYKRRVYLQEPDKYIASTSDIEALTANAPIEPRKLLRRALLFSYAHRFDLAVADLDRVLARDPQNIHALTSRALANVQLGKLDMADADVKAGIAIDPRNIILSHARAQLAQTRGEQASAIEALGNAISADPKDEWALTNRALLLHATSQDDGALIDAATALKLEPKNIQMNLLRANIYRKRGDKAAALAEMRDAAAANPTSDYALVATANMMVGLGQRDDALPLYERALTLKPAAYIYINRAGARDPADIAGRRADYEAALKQEPDSTDAMIGYTQLKIDQKDYAGALPDIEHALTLHPEHPDLIAQRGMVRWFMGQRRSAVQDFAAARAAAKSAAALNGLCWSKATRNIALEEALTDCDAALGKLPDSAATLDSKAFVLLRLGRHADAVVAYDRALAAAPSPIAASLYGRALAEAALGRSGEADQDRIKALTVDPKVADRFRDYGVGTAPTPKLARPAETARTP